ncbi:MAG: hypothetical protein KAI53_05460 [Candidatus Aenigmarchaeota archaeon]|nr:hypothetical protein [Candidatus Aenigmarchaeota archaeon]
MAKRYIHERHYDEYLIAGIISFNIIAAFIAPFFHELFHALVLEIYNCGYWTEFHLSMFTGLYATVFKSCILTRTQEAIVYLSGVLGTLFIGFSLLYLDWKLTKKGLLEYSVFTSFAALGFLFSPTLYFFAGEGDLINALEMLNLSAYSGFLPLIGLAIAFFSIGYLMWNLKHTTELEILEEEIETAKDSKIRKWLKKRMKKKYDKFGIKKTKLRHHKKYNPKR